MCVTSNFSTELPVILIVLLFEIISVILLLEIILIDLLFVDSNVKSLFVCVI